MNLFRSFSIKSTKTDASFDYVFEGGVGFMCVCVVIAF